MKNIIQFYQKYKTSNFFFFLNLKIKRYLCLSSANGLLEHLENTYGILFAAKSIKISYKQCSGYMFLNTSSLNSLEILVNSRNGKRDFSLFSTINHTKTSMGKRLLKSSLLQPLNDISTINNRLDCITELLENEKQFLKISNELKSFFDLDQIISKLIHSTNNSQHSKNLILNLICLKKLLENISTINLSITSSFSNSLFIAIKKNLEHEDINLLIKNINEIIDQDITYKKNSLLMQNQVIHIH